MVLQTILWYFLKKTGSKKMNWYQLVTSMENMWLKQLISLGLLFSIWENSAKLEVNVISMEKYQDFLISLSKKEDSTVDIWSLNVRLTQLRYFSSTSFRKQSVSQTCLSGFYRYFSRTGRLRIYGRIRCKKMLTSCRECIENIRDWAALKFDCCQHHWIEIFWKTE